MAVAPYSYSVLFSPESRPEQFVAPTGVEGRILGSTEAGILVVYLAQSDTGKRLERALRACSDVVRWQRLDRK